MAYDMGPSNCHVARLVPIDTWTSTTTTTTTTMGSTLSERQRDDLYALFSPLLRHINRRADTNQSWITSTPADSPKPLNNSSMNSLLVRCRRRERSFVDQSLVVRLSTRLGTEQQRFARQEMDECYQDAEEGLPLSYPAATRPLTQCR